MRWNDILFDGNLFIDCVVALGIAVGFMLVVLVFKGLAVRRLAAHARKTQTRLDDIFIEVLSGTKPWLLLPLALYIGSQALALPYTPAYILDRITVLALLVQAGVWLNRAVVLWLAHQVTRKREQDAAGANTLALLGFVTRVALWSIVVLLALANLGFDITALLAGLGIGGIAVALAAQNILGDLFGSLSITLDKPFVVGDIIAVDQLQGTVERIGLKSTHIRGLGGELIVVSNADMVKSRIRNYRQMAERRVLLSFGLHHQTPIHIVTAVPSTIREIVEAHDKARFDRAHFTDFRESALNFEAVYFVREPDYMTYMDTQQSINLALLRRFREAGIEFAYPTRTLLVGSALRDGAGGTTPPAGTP